MYQAARRCIEKGNSYVMRLEVGLIEGEKTITLFIINDDSLSDAHANEWQCAEVFEPARYLLHCMVIGDIYSAR